MFSWTNRRCQKCRGMIVLEWKLDLPCEDEYACINCGNRYWEKEEEVSSPVRQNTPLHPQQAQPAASMQNDPSKERFQPIAKGDVTSQERREQPLNHCKENQHAAKEHFQSDHAIHSQNYNPNIQDNCNITELIRKDFNRQKDTEKQWKDTPVDKTLLMCFNEDTKKQILKRQSSQNRNRRKNPPRFNFEKNSFWAQT